MAYKTDPTGQWNLRSPVSTCCHPKTSPVSAVPSGGRKQPNCVAYSLTTRLSRRCGPPGRAVSFSNYFSVRAPAQKKGVHLPHVRLRDDTRQALPVVIAVAIAGAVGLAFAIASVVSNGLSWGDAAGIGVLLTAATLAEAFPFPIEGVAAGTTSLATIFLVA